jgi:hypothetical protein
MENYEEQEAMAVIQAVYMTRNVMRKTLSDIESGEQVVDNRDTLVPELQKQIEILTKVLKNTLGESSELVN